MYKNSDKNNFMTDLGSWKKVEYCMFIKGQFGTPIIKPESWGENVEKSNKDKVFVSVLKHVRKKELSNNKVPGSVPEILKGIEIVNSIDGYCCKL